MLISHHASSVNHRAIAGCVEQVGLCWPASVLNELAEILKDVASWPVKRTPAGVLHLFHPFWIIFPFGRSSPILGYRRWIKGGFHFWCSFWAERNFQLSKFEAPRSLLVETHVICVFSFIFGQTHPLCEICLTIKSENKKSDIKLLMMFFFGKSLIHWRFWPNLDPFGHYP